MRCRCHLEEALPIGACCVGSLTLIGGDPGVGKSTLLLQLAGILSEIPVDEESDVESAVTQSQEVLYASAEESEEQVNLTPPPFLFRDGITARCLRNGYNDTPSPSLSEYEETWKVLLVFSGLEE